jgi:hypothetical protein
MTDHKLTLSLNKELFAVCRLDPDDKIPPWALMDSFCSLTKTPEEISIVCHQEDLPEGIKVERDWRCLKVNGPLDFSLTGILATISQTLADAKISLFSISTFDTDYILVKDRDISKAIKALEQAGHHVKKL